MSISIPGALKMLASHLCYTVLILLLIESSLADKLVFQTVAIYSGCNNTQYDAKNNLNESHQIARDLRKHMQSLMKGVNSTVSSRMMVLHKDFDVCENKTYLLTTLSTFYFHTRTY